MIAYEDLVVALTNWRTQQGLETTALQFSSRSASVDLNLPVAEVLSEEIVEMNAVEEIEEIVDSSLDSEQSAGEVLYDDGEHTSIAESGSFLEEEEEKLETNALEYGNEDTQYTDESLAPEELASESASALVEEEVSVEEILEVEEESDAPIAALDADADAEVELQVEEEIIEAAELQVEEVPDTVIVESEEDSGSGSSTIELGPSGDAELAETRIGAPDTSDDSEN